jgi:vancomycin resistance protein YoaR
VWNGYFSCFFDLTDTQVNTPKIKADDASSRYARRKAMHNDMKANKPSATNLLSTLTTTLTTKRARVSMFDGGAWTVKQRAARKPAFRQGNHGPVSLLHENHPSVLLLRTH